MRVRLKLKPGKRGTKKLLAEYGDRLVCVRYRYDIERKRRFKTVELIVDEIPWQPKPKIKSIKEERIVEISVSWGDLYHYHRVKDAGAVWNREKRVWELTYDRAVEMG